MCSEKSAYCLDAKILGDSYTHILLLTQSVNLDASLLQ